MGISARMIAAAIAAFAKVNTAGNKPLPLDNDKGVIACGVSTPGTTARTTIGRKMSRDSTVKRNENLGRTTETGRVIPSGITSHAT